MKYCSQCGESVEKIIPQGDNRHRFVCVTCEHIHYQNPRIIAGCLPVFKDQILLCRRAIEPRKGYWTLPAGFLENGETTSAGALRETVEEANATVEIQNLYTVFSLPHISQVYMFFLAHLPVAEFSAGIESLEVELFDEADIPWGELSFPVITQTLEHYFADRKKNDFPTRYTNIDRSYLTPK
ncbi:MAG: ADP-ribose pyrophosphatase YjhB (NUDIX family) [Dinoroseobacter sp.]|jgi:ADP-ribose pyrophosphatase YjhB (NUDIX family)